MIDQFNAVSGWITTVLLSEEGLKVKTDYSIRNTTILIPEKLKFQFNLSGYHIFTESKYYLFYCHKLTDVFSIESRPPLRKAH